MKAWRRARLSFLCLLLLFPSRTLAGRLKESLLDALREPRTWAPAAGAVFFAATGLDSRVADWAVRETPVFGSPERARQASDDLRTATHLGMFATGLLAPAVDDDPERLRRTFVDFTAMVMAANSASLFKRITRRTRPDGSDDLSLPSNHSTAAFAYAAMGSRNLAASGLPVGLRRASSIGLTTLAAGSAWARVEAGVHYPSDVLAGAALGSFVSSFIEGAILPADSNVRIGTALDASGAQVWLRWSLR
jgi:membrane-associated phospholipid phosphatase